MHDFPHRGTYTLELITPETARKYLARNIENNRNKRPINIRKWSLEMRAGKWPLTHQGIAFDCHGNLVDGQNRMSAVIDAGVAVWFWVYRGLSGEGLARVDRGGPRTNYDGLKIVGSSVSRPHIPIVRSMLAGFNGGDSQNIMATDSAVEAAVKAHHRAIEFACQHWKYPTAAPFRSAVARAWYHCQHDLARLELFLVVVTDGTSRHPDESAACRLRIWLEGVKRMGGHFRLPVYARTQTALRHFIDRNPVSAIRETRRELFPLPEER